jgi:hypothetical protein
MVEYVAVECRKNYLDAVDGRLIMKTKTGNWRRWAFVLVVVGCVQWVVLTTVAMFYYLGGTLSNHDTVGYSFWNNFFSDLGRRVSLSGDPNIISRSLFAIGYWFLGLLLCLFFAALPCLFAGAKSARRLAIIGSIFGIIGAVSFGIVSVIPWDTHQLAHEIFAVIVRVAFITAAALYSVAILRNELYPKAYAYAFLAFAVIWLVYLILPLAGPSMETAWGNKVQATAQKIAVYAFMICMFIQAYGALRVHKRLRDLGPESMLGKV